MALLYQQIWFSSGLQPANTRTLFLLKSFFCLRFARSSGKASLELHKPSINCSCGVQSHVLTKEGLLCLGFARSSRKELAAAHLEMAIALYVVAATGVNLPIAAREDVANAGVMANIDARNEELTG